MTALVLDFDGVIADSSREAFVVALRAYVALRPGSPLEQALAALEATLPAGAAAVERQPLYPGFMALMPLGNRAEDFGAALEAAAQRREIDDQAGYDIFFAGLERDWLEAFHWRFYHERTRFAGQQPALWRVLQPPYREVVDLLLRRRGSVSLAVATAKDRASVEALLAGYGLAGVFPRELVLDKETGVTKAAHLEHLRRILAVPFADMTFVDDKVRHLDAVAGLGVRCVLAGWGYNGERERRAARERGYTVADLLHLERDLLPAPGMISA
jgi:phosphoglycolate phosphatase-like HAD superfamily hydrolase